MPLKIYDSSFTEAEWKILQYVQPTSPARDTPPTWPRRLILDAIFSVPLGEIARRAWKWCRQLSTWRSVLYGSRPEAACC